MNEKFVCERITNLRTQKNISERQMSLDLGHSPSYINGIASGNKLPSVTELLYICEYFGIEPSEFFNIKKQTTLLQQEAIDYIYQLSDSDTELIVNVIKRIKKHDRV